MLTVKRPMFDSCVDECDVLLTVKGLWGEPPSDWDPQVPFLDPNNKKGDQSKPGQYVLMQMLEYLLKCYVQVSSFIQVA